MALVLTGDPYSDHQAKLAELARRRRIAVEAVPGVSNGQLSVAPIQGTLVQREGQLFLSGYERAIASTTPALSAWLQNRGGTLNVTLTPIGNITGQAVDPNQLILEMGRMAYRVAIR